MSGTPAQRFMQAVDDLELALALGPEETRAAIAVVRSSAAEVGVTSAWPCICGRILAVARPCPACGALPTAPAYLADLLGNLEASLADPNTVLGGYHFRPGGGR